MAPAAKSAHARPREPELPNEAAETLLNQDTGSGESSECSFCLAEMQLEYRSEVAWWVCPNGCRTEHEVPRPDSRWDRPETAAASRMLSQRSGPKN